MLTILTRTYGSVVTAAHLVGQSRVPYLGRQELEAMRDRRLQRTVRYAAATVPYYRELFRAQGIDPAEIRTARDLDRLPLLDKATVRQNPEQFRSTSPLGQSAVPFVTSGTTGQPLKVYHDRDSLLRNTGLNRRESDVIKNLLGERKPLRTAVITYPDNTGARVQQFLRGSRMRPGGADYATFYVSEPVQQVVAKLNGYQPEVIGSYGSYLEALFRMAAAGALDLHLPKVAFYFSDTLTDAGKRLIEDHFHVPVVSRYSAVEAFKIAFTCEQRSGFHMHEDIMDLKVVDSHGRRVEPGQKGEVVISNLANHGTVLLNYRLGDIGVLSAERCSCGRSFALLSTLEGRVEDVIYLRNGGFVHPRVIWSAFKHRSGILRYQLIQTTVDRFELRLVTVDQASFDQSTTEIVAGLHSLLGADSVIEPLRQDELQPYGSAKFRPVIALPRESRV